MSRHRRPAAGFLRRPPDLRVINHDRMWRDVTVELLRGREEVAVERASLARGSSRSWRNVLDGAGDYRVTVSLRYGPRETTEWTVESPRQSRLDVVLVPDGVRTHPGGRRF